MSEKQFRFDLEVSIKYMDTPSAMNSEADHLILLAPSYKHYQNGKVNDIKKYLKSAQAISASLAAPLLMSKTAEELKAFSDRAKQLATNEEQKRATWKEIIDQLQSDKNFDNRFFQLLIDLFCDGCCLVNGTTKLTKEVWQTICETDSVLYERICGEYVANFLNY